MIMDIYNGILLEINLALNPNRRFKIGLVTFIYVESSQTAVLNIYILLCFRCKYIVCTGLKNVYCVEKFEKFITPEVHV